MYLHSMSQLEVFGERHLIPAHTSVGIGQTLNTLNSKFIVRFISCLQVHLSSG